MNEDYANKFIKEGAIFILKNLPIKSEFGVDCKSYQVGEKFNGVKLIPKGLHFIYFNVVSKQDQLGLRSGFFYYFKSKEVLIKIFDTIKEELIDDDLNQDLINQYKFENLPYFDHLLAPYPFEEYKKWISLTDLITEDLLKILNSKSKIIFSVSTVLSKNFISSKDISVDKSKNDLNNLNFKLDEFNLVNFTNLDELKSYPDNSTPQIITQNKIDNSFLLYELFKKYNQNKNFVLGELQFSFIVFLIGQNYDAFEQWKKLIKLICKSSNAMLSEEFFFIEFIRVIFFQIQEIPKESFEDILEDNNLILDCLKNFFFNIKDQKEDLNSELINKSEKFKNFLEKKYFWDLDLEPEEEKPVIVEIN